MIFIHLFMRLFRHREWKLENITVIDGEQIKTYSRRRRREWMTVRT